MIKVFKKYTTLENCDRIEEFNRVDPITDRPRNQESEREMTEVREREDG